MTTANVTKITVGDWTWTDCGEDGEPALCRDHGFEIWAGHDINAAFLKKLSVDLMKLAMQVEAHEKRSKP